MMGTPSIPAEPQIELLILVNAEGTRATVVPAARYDAVPNGYRARVLGPGESLYGIPYELWLERLGTAVELPAQGTHVTAQSPAPSPALLARFDKELPPAKHPADRPRWHWHYVNVRGWARIRRGGPVRLGLFSGLTYTVAGVLLESIRLTWRGGFTVTYLSPGTWIAKIVTGVLFGVVFGTFMWDSMERSYAAALRRREQYDEAQREAEAAKAPESTRMPSPADE